MVSIREEIVQEFATECPRVSARLKKKLSNERSSHLEASKRASDTSEYTWNGIFHSPDGYLETFKNRDFCHFYRILYFRSYQPAEPLRGYSKCHICGGKGGQNELSSRLEGSKRALDTSEYD